MNRLYVHMSLDDCDAFLPLLSSHEYLHLTRISLTQETYRLAIHFLYQQPENPLASSNETNMPICPMHPRTPKFPSGDASNKAQGWAASAMVRRGGAVLDPRRHEPRNSPAGPPPQTSPTFHDVDLASHFHRDGVWRNISRFSG